MSIVALTLAAALQAAPAIDVRREVTSLAFDATTFFTERGSDIVRIAYRGDDRNWPVYSIAIRNGCLTAFVEPCWQHRVARMVRAPLPKRGAERIRARGMDLVTAIGARSPENRAAVAKLIDAADVEWLEADVTRCPGAVDALTATAGLDWVGKYLASRRPGDEELVMHADTVLVEFPSFSRAARYEGYLAPNSPASWAERVAAVLEPCWKPASAPRPWLRTTP